MYCITQESNIQLNALICYLVLVNGIETRNKCQDVLCHSSFTMDPKFVSYLMKFQECTNKHVDD